MGSGHFRGVPCPDTAGSNRTIPAPIVLAASDFVFRHTGTLPFGHFYFNWNALPFTWEFMRSGGPRGVLVAI
jgi:hypothetical protein